MPNQSRTIYTVKAIPKSEIQSIQRESAAHKQQRLAFEDLRRYALHPNQEQPLAVCDQAFAELEKFLAAHPASPFEADVHQRLADWKQEREQVRAGKVKCANRWMTAAEKETAARAAQLVTLTAQHQRLRKNIEATEDAIRSAHETIDQLNEESYKVTGNYKAQAALQKQIADQIKDRWQQIRFLNKQLVQGRKDLNQLEQKIQANSPSPYGATVSPDSFPPAVPPELSGAAGPAAPADGKCTPWIRQRP